MFLSPLKGKSGSRENMCLVLDITAENCEIFEHEIFDCKVLWMVGEGQRNSVGFFVL